jgi:hypothetical protein
MFQHFTFEIKVVIYRIQCRGIFAKKDRNKRHSSPFINVVKGVFFVVRVTLVPVSYLSAPSEGSLFCLFLKLVQINFIFTDNVRILYIYPAISTFAVQICYANKCLLYSCQI